VSPEEGKLLYLLLLMVRAKRVLEIGSLGGYSGVWLARALPADGKLITIEKDPRHARIAREGFRAAGLEQRVELIEGGALEILPTLTPGFDAVFIDADKEPLPTYFDWGMRLLRTGGLLLCDNAFFHGAAINEADRSGNALGVRAFNKLAAGDARLVATIIPVRDGLVVGLKTKDGA
jgi:predicted O-methyltransferase YrrM